jgi:kynurenine 3-monooxygenase
MNRVTLIGGGLAGSVMAVYLAQRGMKVDLFERRPDMRSEEIPAGRSINLALSTRGLRALEKIGLKETILSEAIPMHGRMMHDTQGNLTYQPYGKKGQYINSVSRAHLNIQLLKLADENPDVDLHFEHKCLDVDLEKANATFKDGKGNRKQISGDFIIGADGAYSAVRMRMQKSGRFNYSQSYLNSGYKELTIPPTASGDYAMEPNALHIWPRGSFMLIALPNTDKSFTCTLFMPYEGDPGFDDIHDADGVTQFFERHFPDVIPLIPELTTEFLENPTGSLVTVRCYPWTVGKTVLLGDAAHAIVPFYGQGMNAAFEDCVVLDECIEEHGPDWNTVFSTYQESRKVNADAIADLALQNFIEMRDLVGDEAFLLQKQVENTLAENYPELFRSQYELVTFTNEPYSHALNQGAENTKMVAQMIEEGLHHQLEDQQAITSFIKNYRTG